MARQSTIRAVGDKILEVIEVLRQSGMPLIEQAQDCPYLPNGIYIWFDRPLTMENIRVLRVLNIELKHHRPMSTVDLHRYLLEFVPSPNDEE